VDVRSVVMAVLARLRPAARHKKITLSWKRSGSAGLYTVPGDQPQLTSLFFNLVENAVKYTPAGGWVNVTGCLDESEVVVRVSDTGIGISERASRVSSSAFTE
jgi:signal transduction histidine kinase